MKSLSRKILATVVGLSIALPISAAATSSTNTSGKTTTDHYSSQAKMDPSGSLSLSRVRESWLENQFTANDLIGQTVKGMDGETLGNITDISLAGISGDLMDEYKEKTDQRNQMMDGSDHMKTDRRDHMKMSNESVAYISVGGFLGFGDDLVSVPLSALSYNATEECFVLNVKKADFVALAEQKIPTYADNEMNRSGSQGTYASASGSAKVDWNDEKKEIHKALSSDSSTSKLASAIQLSMDDDEVIVRGTVPTSQDRKRIIDVVKANSRLEVKDELKVQK